MKLAGQSMKWRKFAYTQRTDRQSNGSKTETTLSSVDTRGSWPIEYFNSPAFPPVRIVQGIERYCLEVLFVLRDVRE